MQYQNIVVERLEDGIVKITLNRPKVLNALNNAIWQELLDVFQMIEKDIDVNVAILTGAGRAFSAGVDLKDPGFSKSGHVSDDVYNFMRGSTVPIIAQVNGFAITGGMELALACDIIIAAETAKFRDTHVQAGIIPGGGNSQILPRLIGEKKAKEILFGSEFITASDAYNMGMINKVVPDERLEQEVMQLAKKIAAQPKPMIGKMKRLVNMGMGLDLNTALILEHLESVITRTSTDLNEFKLKGSAIIEGGQTTARNDM